VDVAARRFWILLDGGSEDGHEASLALCPEKLGSGKSKDEKKAIDPIFE